MKKINIIYWISTIVFAGLMIFSAVPDILNSQQAVDFMNGMLGYPKYIIPFIGWAKIIGVAVLLIPVPARIREWAYAGLAFDLGGALYSAFAVFGFQTANLMMLLWVAPGVVSYIYFHKRKMARNI